MPTRASARALAAMARVTGVAPAQLARAGREDAARVLEEILRRDTATVADSLAVVAAPRPAQVPRQDVDFGADIPPEELAPLIEDIEQAAYRALTDLYPGDLPGPDGPGVRETMLGLPGKAVFPGNEDEQHVWDNPVYSPGERVKLIARLRWLTDQMAKEQRRRTGTGLIGHVPATGAVTALISVGGKALRASS